MLGLRTPLSLAAPILDYLGDNVSHKTAHHHQVRAKTEICLRYFEVSVTGSDSDEDDGAPEEPDHEPSCVQHCHCLFKRTEW